MAGLHLPGVFDTLELISNNQVTIPCLHVPHPMQPSCWQGASTGSVELWEIFRLMASTLCKVIVQIFPGAMCIPQA
jgi:hypothetical protein